MRMKFLEKKHASIADVPDPVELAVCVASNHDHGNDAGDRRKGIKLS